MVKYKKSEKATRCKNCNNLLKGNYCSNCGQSAETSRLNIHPSGKKSKNRESLFDKGLFYTLIQLFTRPGHSIREYIEGKRVKHYKPVSLVILLATGYGILYHFFHIDLTNDSISESGINPEMFNEWVATHFSWITLATIPFYTIGTIIFFRKQGYNFAEYLTLNTFKAGQRLCIQIILFPLLFFFNETDSINTVTGIIYVTGFSFMLWTNVQFFNNLSKIRVLVLSLLSHLLFLIMIILIAFIVLWITGKNL